MNRITEVGNNSVMYIRVYGNLVPINKVNFVQVNPNNSKIVQEMPLTEPINLLMYMNMHDFIKPFDDLKTFNEEGNISSLDGALSPNFNKG